MNLKTILTLLFAIFIILGGINHFLKPAMYLPFIPSFLPQMLINYLSGIFEILIGLGLFFPKYKRQSAKACFYLMLAFLPLHIWDVFRSDPAIGSHDLALIRLPVQFVFIFWTWFIYKK
jgi:uncharacterized membrane protein